MDTGRYCLLSARRRNPNQASSRQQQGRCGGYAPCYDDSAYVDDWATFLDHFEVSAIDAVYPARADFDEAMAKAGAAPVTEAAE